MAARKLLSGLDMARGLCVVVLFDAQTGDGWALSFDPTDRTVGVGRVRVDPEKPDGIHFERKQDKPFVGEAAKGTNTIVWHLGRAAVGLPEDDLRKMVEEAQDVLCRGGGGSA